MIDTLIFLKGLAIGVAVSAPVGPVNVMAIQRALHQGFWGGVIAGAGAIAADALFAAAAAFGVGAVLQFVAGHQYLIQAVGGALLVAFGAFTMRMHPHLTGEASGRSGPMASFATSFAMTFTNPGAALGAIALVGAMAPEPDGAWLAPFVLVGGVVTGGLIWWAVVSGFASYLRDRLTDGWLETINRTAGIVLLLFGLGLLAQLAWKSLSPA